MNFDGKGEFTFKNGDWFKGEIKNGEFHTGKGKKTYEDDKYFEGEWEDGKPYKGKGIFTFKNGDIHEGNFEYGRLNGKGKKTENGDIHEGEFDNGSLHGKGKLTEKRGDIHEGNFERGALIKGKLTRWDATSGQGKRTLKSGEVWEGDFDGHHPPRLHGKGKFTGRGMLVEGDFECGEFRGGNITFGDSGDDKRRGETWEGKFHWEEGTPTPVW